MNMLLGVLAVATVAGTTPEEATARFNQGVEFAEQGDYARALSIWLETTDHLPEAYRPFVHLNIGQAYEKLGRLAESWHHIGIYLESQQDDAETAALRKDIATRLATNHRDVEISCAPEGSKVKPSGGRMYPCPLRWWFTPGDQTVRVEPPGPGYVGKDATFIVTMARELQRVQVALEPAPKSAEPTPAKGGEAGAGTKGTEADVKKEAPPPGSGKGLAWGLTLGGGAAILAGVGLQLVAMSAESDLASKYPDGTPEKPAPAENQKLYQEGYDSDVKPKLLGAWILGGLGLAATGAGVWLLMSDDGPSDAAAAPWVGPDGAGFVFQGRF